MEREAYCLKCREKTAMKECMVVEMKNKRKAVKGRCSVCGTSMYSILSAADALKLEEAGDAGSN